MAEEKPKRRVNWNKITGVILIIVSLAGIFYLLLVDRENTEAVKLAFIGFFGIVIAKGVDLFKRKS